MFEPEPLPEIPCTLLQAMAKVEGWYDTDGPNRPQRNNNPGDLIYVPEAAFFGAFLETPLPGEIPRFAAFREAGALGIEGSGWEALRRWLLVPARFQRGELVGGYCGATLSQVINRFAPSAENDVTAYIDVVCTLSRIAPDTIITEDFINEGMSE